MNHNETIKVGATLRQALKTIEDQGMELNLLRTEVNAYRAVLKLKGDWIVDNNIIINNIEKTLHQLSHSQIKDEYQDNGEEYGYTDSEQTVMECTDMMP